MHLSNPVTVILLEYSDCGHVIEKSGYHNWLGEFNKYPATYT